MIWGDDRRTLWGALFLAGMLLTACGTLEGVQGSGVTATIAVTPPATVIRAITPGTSVPQRTPGSPVAGTPQAGREALRVVLLGQIDEYQREIEAAARDGRCDPPAQGTSAPLCKDRALAVIRDRHAEFTAYVQWLEREFNCGPATATPKPCTLVALLPAPEQLRDPKNLDRYLDAVAK